MNKKKAHHKPRRPPGSRHAPWPDFMPQSKPRPAAGGPSTRNDPLIGRLLANFLAYFEVRTVTTHEIELLKPTHANGWLRPQIEAKLATLHPECKDHRELHRLVTLSLDLLTAVEEGRFNPGEYWSDIEPRLLRALAYLIREEDAIPDHLPTGFDDDMREFNLLAEHAGILFAGFELYQHRERKSNSNS